MKSKRMKVKASSELQATLGIDEQYGDGLPSDVKNGMEEADLLGYRLAQKDGDKYSGWLFRPGCVTIELANKYLGAGSVGEKDLKGYNEAVHDYFYNVGKNMAELYKTKGIPEKWKANVHYTTYDIDIYSDNVCTTYEFEFRNIPESQLSQLAQDMSDHLQRLEENDSEMKKVFTDVEDKLPSRSATSSARRLGSRFAHAAKNEGNAFQEQVKSIAKNEGWSVSFDEGEDGIEFSQCSPAGEDFFFTVYPESEDLSALQEAIYNYVMSYDVEEEASIWLDEDGNGINGAPDREALIEDKEAILDMVKSLELAVLTASKSGKKATGSARRARAVSIDELADKYDEDLISGIESAYKEKGFARLEGDCTPRKAVLYKNAFAVTTPDSSTTFSVVTEITVDTITHKLLGHSAAGGIDDPIAVMTHKTNKGMAKSYAKYLASAIDKAIDAVSYL